MLKIPSRLKNIITLEDYNSIMEVYQEAKNNPNITINDFVVIKSFLAKMIYAQTEYIDNDSGDITTPSNPNAGKKWREPKSYIDLRKNNNDTKYFITNIVKQLRSGFRAYDFDFNQDNGLLI